MFCTFLLPVGGIFGSPERAGIVYRPPCEEALSMIKSERSGNLLLDRLPKEEHHRLLRIGEVETAEDLRDAVTGFPHAALRGTTTT